MACDTPAGIRECALELADAASIQEALTAARGMLGEDGIDWEQGTVGIYGRVRPRGHVPQDGDRIELYRPLRIDPREHRRARAAREPPRRRR